MHIRVSQSGGFAGIPIELGSVDTAAMPTAEGKRLERLVHDATFFQRSAEGGAATPTVGADVGLRYEITVQDGPRSHTVALTDDGGSAAAADDGLRALLNAVTGRG